MSERWIDDPDAGPQPTTSHPSFVEAAPDWFFDEGDGLAPFGSDAGHDALRAFEEWAAAGGVDADWQAFVDDETEAWGLGVPDEVYDGDPAEAVAWLQDGGEDHVLQADAQRRLATALALWKVRGHLTAHARQSAAHAVLVQRVLLERFAITYPEWELADEAHSRLAAIIDALRSAPVRG